MNFFFLLALYINTCSWDVHKLVILPNGFQEVPPVTYMCMCKCKILTIKFDGIII